MTTAPYITCREFIGFLDAYLDESLPAPHRHEFERHLGVCKSCADYIEGYRRTIRLGKLAMPVNDDPVDSSVPSSLIKAVLAARPNRKS